MATELVPPTGAAAGGIDVIAFRETDEGKQLLAWVKSEYEKAKQARKSKELQWYTNLSMALGNQWVRKASGSSNVDGALVKPSTPYYKQRRTVNRARRFTRWELSKLISQTPEIVSVPGTGDDQDIRASFAAEQVWKYESTHKKLRKVFARSAWWMVHTGNGFLKTEWDPDCYDGQGDIKYSSITPFNLFVPDLKESELEDQPFVVLAYTKPVTWANQFFGPQLDGKKLEASTSAANELLDPAYLNITKQNQQSKDSVVVIECWVKPGATDLLPNGGLVILVEDVLLTVVNTGLPYRHGEYPFTHFIHLDTGGFYADSPLVDLNQLQKEYNQIRSDISEAGRRMARPQLLAAKGSVVASKITNEPGLVIEYLPGTPPPTPMPMPELPMYFIQQQDRVLQDWEELSGESDASTGQAPPGVSAGTAINYLQEAANKYLTPQFQSIEFGWERIAQQTIALFVQYVDVPRQIKTVGADQAFDTMQLAGSDVSNGTDLRVEAGSSVTQSKAANDAKAMDLFSIGAIDQPTLMRMLEVGGFQRTMDIIKAAERKAQRENVKMKQLDPGQIQNAALEHQQEILQQLDQHAQQAQSPEDLQAVQQMQQQVSDPANVQAPPLVAVADFDVHEIHIQVHNQYRMMQEYETLPPEIQQQFEAHVAEHQQYIQQAAMQQFLSQVPSDGSDGSQQTDQAPGAPPQPGEGPPASLPAGEQGGPVAA